MPYITKAIEAWIREKFNLQEEPSRATDLQLLQLVVPVTSVDSLVQNQKIETLATVTRLAASGTGYMTLYTQPTGKRYYIRVMDILRQSGDGVFTGVENADGPGVQLLSQGAAAGLRSGILSQDVVLDPGQLLTIYISSISTDTEWKLHAKFAEEDVRVAT